MEIIGECPSEYTAKVADRLQELMISSAATVCSVPMKVDTYIVRRWLIDDFTNYVHDKYKKAVVEGKDPEEEREELSKEFDMISKNVFDAMVDGTYDIENSEEI